MSINSLSIILGEDWQFLILASRKGVCGYIRMIVDGISLVLIHGLIVDFGIFVDGSLKPIRNSIRLCRASMLVESFPSPSTAFNTGRIS